MRSAMKWLDEAGSLEGGAVFLDFDGTLAPIVERPEKARALDGTAELVEALGEKVPVAVISGRGLGDIRRRFGVGGIYYAGSHGIEICTPEGDLHQPEAIGDLLPVVERKEEELRDRFADEEGVEIERKRFGVAVHFRRAPSACEAVERTLSRIARENEGWKVGAGKMVRELQPNLSWDKGTALRFIRGRIEADGERVWPIYIGDDRTDEDAFLAVADDGIGVLVAQRERETAAQYRLDDPDEVQRFLRGLYQRV